VLPAVQQPALPTVPQGAAAARPAQAENPAVLFMAALPGQQGSESPQERSREDLGRRESRRRLLAAASGCRQRGGRWLGRQEEAAAGVGAEQSSVQVTPRQLLFRVDLSAARSCGKGGKSCSESGSPQPTSVGGLGFWGFLISFFSFFFPSWIFGDIPAHSCFSSPFLYVVVRKMGWDSRINRLPFFCLCVLHFPGWCLAFSG